MSNKIGGVRLVGGLKTGKSALMSGLSGDAERGLGRRLGRRAEAELGASKNALVSGLKGRRAEAELGASKSALMSGLKSSGLASELGTNGGGGINRKKIRQKTATSA